MRVLWFSQSPCGSLRRYNTRKTNQGWLISLEDELKKNPSIDLNVAFFTNRDEPPFEFDGVHYYPMYENKHKGILGHIFDRLIPMERIDKKRLRQMLQVIDQCNPDIIHLNGTENSFCEILGCVHKIPVIISIQGLLSSISEKYFSGLPKSQILRNEKFKHKISFQGINRNFADFKAKADREISYIAKSRYIFGRTFYDYSVCLGINPDIKYFVADEMLRPEFYIHNWKDEHRSRNKVILSSTLSPSPCYKGYETLLKTARILKNNSKLNFEWNVIGYDKVSKWVSITEKILGYTHADVSVNLLGNKSAGKMIKVLMDSNMYVHVSHIENSPNSVCEAMLMGMPVIASYAGGTASLLKDEVEGKLYQDGDPYVLAGIIMDFVKNPDKAQYYAMAGRERAMIRHDKSRIVNQVVSGYEQVISDYNS